MEKLIQFVTDNIFWIIIAITILSGFGKSKKKREASQEVPPPQRPQEQTAGDRWEDEEEDDIFVPEPNKNPDKEMESLPGPLRDIVQRLEDWSGEKPFSPPPSRPAQPQPAPVVVREHPYEDSPWRGSEGISQEGPPLRAVPALAPTIKEAAALALTKQETAPVIRNIGATAVDESRLREAVIWSEILGPPKARRRQAGR